MGKLEYLDTFASYGVPTFYVTKAIAEDAGGGNMRVWNCAERNGVLTPVCEIIIPALSLIVAGRNVTEAAMDIFNRAQMTGPRH